jgi:SAM-dependent methyltransferase
VDEAQAPFFFALHSGLPRVAPGSRGSTLRALAATGRAETARSVLDLGCGPGAHTIELARAMPQARISGLDLHAPFLEDLRARAASAGVGGRVQGVHADMAAPPFADQYFDLLWSEGAIYQLGVGPALACWRRLLRPGGVLAFSDAVFLPGAPVDLVAHWHRDYPSMTDVVGARAVVQAAGWQVLDDFLQPASDWEAYYDPLAARCDALEADWQNDPAGLAVLAETRAEIAFHRTWGQHYGYAFFVVAPA